MLVLSVLCCFVFGASSCSFQSKKPDAAQTVKIQSPDKASPTPKPAALVAQVTPELIVAEQVMRQESAQMSVAYAQVQQAPAFAVQAAYASLAVPAEVAEDPDVMPEFPWPPPQPSEQAKVPASVLKREEGATLKDLDAQIQHALSGAGYDSNRYFRIPNGFAIATRMERYENDGSSSADAERWVVSDSAPSSFSLRSFLTALFTGKTGQYRLFVLTVTDRPFGTDPDATLTSEDAERLMAIGWNGLPRSISSRPWTDEVDVQALVYEFEKSEGKAPEVRKPRASGEAHLKGSKILSHFTP